MFFNPFLAAGKKGDACVYVELVGRKRALLFDAGEFNLANGQLKKISDIFISHTHMDHFIGFDRILRPNITEDKTIRIFGPPGIIKHVEGKLSGYVWNITDQLFLKLEAYEINGNKLNIERFSSHFGFKSTKLPSRKIENNILYKDENMIITYAELDHKTISVGYSVTSSEGYSVNKSKLTEHNFIPGPWLGKLKTLVGHKKDPRTKLNVQGKIYTIGYLKQELLIRKKEMKITYVTDVLYSKENAIKIIKLAKKSTFFFCETCFLTQDKDRAKLTYHLTAKQTGTLAKKANVSTLVPFHISKRYQEVDPLIAEARERFENVK